MNKNIFYGVILSVLTLGLSSNIIFGENEKGGEPMTVKNVQWLAENRGWLEKRLGQLEDQIKDLESEKEHAEDQMRRVKEKLEELK